MHFCRPVKMGQSFITAQWKIYGVFGADLQVFGADRPGVRNVHPCVAARLPTAWLGPICRLTARWKDDSVDEVFSATKRCDIVHGRD